MERDSVVRKLIATPFPLKNSQPSPAQSGQCCLGNIVMTNNIIDIRMVGLQAVMFCVKRDNIASTHDLQWMEAGCNKDQKV